MVEYSGGDNIFEEEIQDNIVIDNNTKVGAYPRLVPSDFFPEVPTLSNPSAAEAYLPFLLDQESYLKEYGAPQISDEELEKVYSKSDFTNERNLAIAKAGFALMQPTQGGQIGASISAAGQGLTNDLAAIQGARRKEAKASAVGLINAKMQREAKQTLERKAVFDANRGLLMQVAGKDYDAEIASDKALMAAYTDAMKSSQTKWTDYQMKGVEPKRVQVRMKGASGELEGNAFDAYVIQSINEADGSLNPPQYYKPTNEVGANGEVMYELIDNPEGIVEVKTTISGTPDDFKSSSGTTKFLDALSGLQTNDRGLRTLDLMYQSFVDKPSRAGAFAGVQKYVQTYSQIFSDFYNSQFNNFFNEDKTLSDGRKIKGGEKFQSLSSSINFTLQSEKYLADLKAGVINKEDHEALVAANNSFSQLGAVGRGQMAAEINGGKNKFGIELFENEDERRAIFNKLGWFDTELPANEVRANSIIYAIARARKSSGRLNLDDIERAAKDLNIFGDSSVDVMVKIKELRRQLLEARADTLEQIRYTFPAYHAQMMEDGYAEYDSKRTDDLINQGAGSGSLDKGAGSTFTITLDGEVVLN
tara:strand:+ start:827 stop:2593 length:1767 start_codon:yes stop_codon:yes gene_type:complete